MIGAPTDFRHIEGAKIGASGRMEKVQGKFIFANKPFFIRFWKNLLNHLYRPSIDMKNRPIEMFQIRIFVWAVENFFIQFTSVINVDQNR